MVSLFLTIFLTFNNLFVISLDKGMVIYGGLFHVTAFAQSFNLFIILISAIIFTLTSFHSSNVKLITAFCIINTNVVLALKVFNLSFPFICFLFNSELLEGYLLLSTNHNPMDINSLLNPGDNPGMPGGQPSNNNTPVAPQSNSGSGDNSEDNTNIASNSVSPVYNECADFLENKVEQTKPHHARKTHFSLRDLGIYKSNIHYKALLDFSEATKDRFPDMHSKLHTRHYREAIIYPGDSTIIDALRNHRPSN